MNLVLIGMPLSGKTTVGSILAAKLGYEFADTDEYIESHYGNIPEIFNTFGESYFRNLESAAVKRFAAADRTVISTGGGCVKNPDNMRLLKSTGKIIYLQTDAALLFSRYRLDLSLRPLLGGDPASNLKQLLKEREGLYVFYSDLTVTTDGLTPEEVAEKIMENLK